MTETKLTGKEEIKEWIAKAKQGDVESFEALILSCKGKAYNIAFRYMRNEEDAMDVLQESFIKIYRHLDKFNEQSQFDTWVYRIVVNAANDMLRKNKKLQTIDSIYRIEDNDEYVVDIPDKSPGPEMILERREESHYILECLERSGHDHKEILVLRDIQGFTYEEIAVILDCSIGTVKSRLSRARHHLKEIYQGKK